MSTCWIKVIHKVLFSLDPIIVAYGSKMNNGVVSALSFFQKGSYIYDPQMKLRGLYSVYQAELTVLDNTLKWVVH